MLQTFVTTLLEQALVAICCRC